MECLAGGMRLGAARAKEWGCVQRRVAGATSDLFGRWLPECPGGRAIAESTAELSGVPQAYCGARGEPN